LLQALVSYLARIEIDPDGFGFEGMLEDIIEDVFLVTAVSEGDVNTVQIWFDDLLVED
jgi:hypothetical protein